MEATVELFGSLLHVTDSGVFDIRNKRDCPIHKVKGGECFILLKNGDKLEKISYGLFILHAFKRFFLPFQYWKKIKVGFLNQNFEDYTLANLYLRYPKEGIEHPENKGYYYIPGYELNLINKKGCVIRILKGKVTTPTISEKQKEQNVSYVYTTVDINQERNSGRVVHRLLAITFKDPPENYPLLVVDHLNGKKYDFALDNLEWVTSQVNNSRAVKNGLREDGTVVLVKDKITGEVTQYFSLTELARSLGVHPQYIVDGKTNANQTYKGRYVIKDLDDERDWSFFENIKLSGKGMGVRARCVTTGVITTYKSTKQASKVTGTHQNAIAQYFRNKSDPCIINGYEWKLESDMTTWTDFSEYQIEVYRRGLHRNTRVYEVLDLETREVTIHYGWKLLSELTGADKRTVINAGKANSVVGKRYKLKALN